MIDGVNWTYARFCSTLVSKMRRNYTKPKFSSKLFQSCSNLSVWDKVMVAWRAQSVWLSCWAPRWSSYKPSALMSPPLCAGSCAALSYSQVLRSTYRDMWNCYRPCFCAHDTKARKSEHFLHSSCTFDLSFVLNALVTPVPPALLHSKCMWRDFSLKEEL